MASRSHLLRSALSIPLANSGTFGSTSTPYADDVITSGTPPTRVATTGVPHARDSINTFGQPSLQLDKQLTSAALYHKLSFSFDWSPGSDTRPCKPFSRTILSSRSRRGPSPRIYNAIFGQRDMISEVAEIKNA